MRRTKGRAGPTMACAYVAWMKPLSLDIISVLAGGFKGIQGADALCHMPPDRRSLIICCKRVQCRLRPHVSGGKMPGPSCGSGPMGGPRIHESICCISTRTGSVPRVAVVARGTEIGRAHV